MSDPTNTNETADLETPPDAAADAPAPTSEEVIARLETEKEELRTQFIRLYADLDNTRKRADREVSEARVYAIGKFAGD
ncbi:MAG: nucleotide exchange factor GrpE, partial [Hyphomonas sp.]|nr:nucleotide exchange factor GrpE [Hyphomonas sp.]